MTPCRYRLHSYARFRKETFGGILFNTKTFAMLKVNKPAYGILDALSRVERIEDIHHSLIAAGLATDAKEDLAVIGSFLKYLASINIVLPC